MPHIFPYFGKFAIASTRLTSSVLIALSMTLNTAVLAEPAKGPIPNPAPNNQATPLPVPNPAPTEQSTNPIAQKLIGEWQTKDPSSPVTLTFMFSPDGKLYVLSPDTKTPVAVEFQYQINPTAQPMHLTIIVSKEKQPVLTIFEFTTDGQLRLQLDNTDPGKPRPTAFSPTATLFTKVSETTKLPENTKFINPQL
ncbi:hypothetical protein H6G64_02980 [Calothrix sp. FACHB-156]|nr:hypothetical protein [Calothrix sp. FACHB-156]